ncbi:MAG: MFS transporter [Planctomycetes bacterium]|nr:MFS transporter [Planctomycetota bacterium]
MRRIVQVYRDAFRGLPATTWALSGIALVNRSGTMVLPFLTLWVTQRRGLDTDTAGWLLGVFGCGAITGNALGGRLTDRIGPAPTMSVAMLVAALAFFVVGQLEQPLAIGAALFAAGTAVESFRPANGAALVATCPVREHRRAFALNRLAINAGMAVGPTIGGVLAEIDYDLLFAVNAGACALTALGVRGVARHLRTPAHDPTGPTDPTTSPFADRRFLAFLGMTMLTATAFLQSLGTMPLYFREHYGLGEAAIGLLFAINPVLIVLFEMALVHAIRHRPPLAVIAWGAALVGLGMALLPFGRSLPFAAGTLAIWTVGEMLESPLVPAWISARAGPARRGRYLGCYGMAFGVALIVAPIAGTHVYESCGPTVLWLGCGAAAGLASLGYLRLHRSGA